VSQQPFPIQSVEKPILCSPFKEPARHWSYRCGMPEIVPYRRPASCRYNTEEVYISQMDMFGEEQREDLSLINALREDVKRWRDSGYEGATEITKELLHYWQRADRERRLFFCQAEAVATIIYLTEIRLAGK
jgi:type III restriction enzyme